MAKKITPMNIANIMKLLNNAKSDDETRYFMDSVYYDAAHDGAPARLVATDGRRLVIWEPEAKGKAEALSAIQRAGAIEKSGFVDLDPKAAVMRPTLDSRLFGAQFPNYEKVIPDADDMVDARSFVDGAPLPSCAIWIANEGIAVNPEYVVDIPALNDAKVMKHKETPDKRSVTLELSSDDGRLLVVVMPMSKD